MPRPIARPRPVAAKTGSASVSTTLHRKKEMMQEDHRDELVDGPRVREPHARVSVGVGQTINMGDFNMLRVDVRIELPCSPDEVEVTYKNASELAATYLLEERKLWIPGE